MIINLTVMSARNGETISTRLASELATLFYYYPPRELSRNLRKMFLDYVEGELTIGVPDYFEELAPGLNWLFNFLDVAEEEVTETHDKRTRLGPTSNSSRPMNSMEDIVGYIVHMLAPEKIYSLSYVDPLKRDRDTYYDLLIVMPDASQKPFKSYEMLIEVCCFNNSHVNCSLHQSATLANHIREGNPFYSSVCIVDNLVYTNGTSTLPAPDPARIAAAKLEAKKVFMASYHKALSFLDGARIYFDKGAFDISSFMLQQSAELTLRGMIMAFTGRDVRTHSVAELVKNCRRVVPQVALSLMGKGDEEDGLLRMVETAYLDARYKEGYSVKEEELKELMWRVEVMMEEAERVWREE